MPAQLLTADEVAARLGVKVTSVRKYQERDGLTPTQHVGRTPLWSAAAVDSWKASRPGKGPRAKQAAP